MGVSVLDILSQCDWDYAVSTTTLVEIKRSYSLTDCEGNVMPVTVR